MKVYLNGSGGLFVCVWEPRLSQYEVDGRGCGQSHTARFRRNADGVVSPCNVLAKCSSYLGCAQKCVSIEDDALRASGARSEYD